MTPARHGTQPQYPIASSFDVSRDPRIPQSVQSSHYNGPHGSTIHSGGIPAFSSIYQSTMPIDSSTMRTSQSVRHSQSNSERGSLPSFRPDSAVQWEASPTYTSQDPFWVPQTTSPTFNHAKSVSYPIRPPSDPRGFPMPTRSVSAGWRNNATFETASFPSGVHSATIPTTTVPMGSRYHRQTRETVRDRISRMETVEMLHATGGDPIVAIDRPVGSIESTEVGCLQTL